MSKTALIVIDVQESFKHAPYWDDTEFAGYAERQNKLISAARSKGWPVVFILHNAKSGVFSPESGYVRLMDFVDAREDDPVFNKWAHNAVLKTGLQEWLQEQGIEKIVVSGIRTEQCCESTTRLASDLGYKMEFVLDATLTFPMVHPLTGETVSPEQIRKHTALVLEKRFASIKFVEDYLVKS
ncbi:cysteine hydrolase [Hahella sp. CCB-MM4]|uniref:cysteine hydrolase family protein n=1 Tax=Hahella sp. (strain CCB-MM4) TaxID=1926491 RepID=UPI000B9A4679|nr:cysteine hydrolase family protein [Hahella sp. CCB-MM4]OZG70073.1 cysteine hydrolase [Hahella sp. CCB-MM4]